MLQLIFKEINFLNVDDLKNFKEEGGVQILKVLRCHAVLKLCYGNCPEKEPLFWLHFHQLYEVLYILGCFCM
jgi:hypothetical protein